jgi:uncharacterized protein (DUF1501 family)
MNSSTPARRYFFQQCGLGLGKIALASLLARGSFAAENESNSPAAKNSTNPLAPRAPHFPPKVKRVLYLFMAGAPSQLELFDNKPTLTKYDGQLIPPEVVKGQRYAFIQRNSKLLAPRFKFARHGQSGAELSEMLPRLAEVADELAIVKSVHTDQFNHAPAQILLSTGSSLPGRPSMGSWVTYGLGSECDNLPGYVVLTSGGGASGGAANFASGFLPTMHAGVPFRRQGDPILNVANPPGIDRQAQRDSLDLIKSLNEQRLAQVGDPEIAARINAYEMAYQMQMSAPELMDFSQEDKQTLELYGAKPGEASFANNCLLARRLVERGVRFVTLFHEAWDHHSDVAGGVKTQTGLTDRPSAALLKDLKQRGLLKDTLVIWGGEFGRTPMVESNASLGRALGRDHHPQAFSIWLAGGGLKTGQTIGATDDIGFHIVEKPIHVHDLQATILHLLGLDHEKLTFPFQGRQFRLTDVHGKVVKELLA